MRRDSVTLEVDDENRTVALWQDDGSGVRIPLTSPEWRDVETMPLAYDWLDALDMESLT